MTKLSEHFTLSEMCKTHVKGFNNIPNGAQRDNLKRLCGWLEELRQEWGNEPIIINSAFRSPSINKAVGGVPTSNHLTGCAADIRVLGMEQALRYAVLLLDIADRQKKDFDEMILERSKNSIWLHFAVRPENNRHRIKFIDV